MPQAVEGLTGPPTTQRPLRRMGSRCVLFGKPHCVIPGCTLLALGWELRGCRLGCHPVLPLSTCAGTLAAFSGHRPAELKDGPHGTPAHVLEVVIENGLQVGVHKPLGLAPVAGLLPHSLLLGSMSRCSRACGLCTRTDVSSAARFCPRCKKGRQGA